jgi:hypothetical protein
MDTKTSRLMQWWFSLDDRGRQVASALVLIGLVYTGHYLFFCFPQPFYIEDAGISFAYARNLVQGDGLATYVGGPRVEGFSNPSWTFLIAGLYALGLPPFTTAKVLGWIFGILTLPLAWGLVRRALEDRPKAAFHRDFLALMAPFALATSAQFVIWNSSGLENSLFCLLLALGLWRCVVELEDGGRPWSALVFFLLCASRPEGIMYTAVALGLRLWHMLFSDEAKGLAFRKRISVVTHWTLLLVVPLVAFHAWRYWYFAWEFPNTYYAKLGTGRAFRPFSWTKKGWKYINAWMLPHGGVAFIPVLLIGLVGFKKRLRWATGFALVVLGVLLLWDGSAGLNNPPSWWLSTSGMWVKLRVWALAALIPALWFASLGSSAWRARGLLWLCSAAGLFFVVYVGGDWMKAHRWFNLFSVALLGIVTVGVAEIALAIAGENAPGTSVGRLGGRRGLACLFLGLVLVGWGGNEARLSAKFLRNPETSVRDIHRRVKYMRWVQNRLDVDHITLLDVDMGAHMYFTDWAIVDVAGLVDVPMARHSDFNKRFLREYLFEERKPDFAHIHGGWARASKIPKIAAFKRDFIEIPGYPIGTRKLHIGNHINKRLFVRESDSRPVVAQFKTDVSMVEFDVPSPAVQPGGQLFVATAWRAAYRKQGFRVLMALSAKDGTRTVSSFAPGYDWYPPKEWGKSETIEGKFKVSVPKSFPRGLATLSVVLLDEGTGEVLGVDGDPDHPWTVGALDATVQIVITDSDAVALAAAFDRKAALAASKAGACETVWPTWKNAIRHGPFRAAWIAQHDASLRTAVASCFTARAAATDVLQTQVDALLSALVWDHQYPALVALARPLAERLEADGDALWLEADLDGAYSAFNQSVALDPRRSWARRKAEDVRDLRLKIIRPSRKKKRAKKRG